MFASLAYSLTLSIFTFISSCLTISRLNFSLASFYNHLASAYSRSKWSGEMTKWRGDAYVEASRQKWDPQALIWLRIVLESQEVTQIYSDSHFSTWLQLTAWINRFTTGDGAGRLNGVLSPGAIMSLFGRCGGEGRGENSIRQIGGRIKYLWCCGKRKVRKDREGKERSLNQLIAKGWTKQSPNLF